MSVLTIKRGDDETRTVTVTLTGVAVDLETAQAVTFTAKRRVTDDDADAVIQLSLGDGVSVEANVATLTFDHDTTAALDAPAILPWDLEIVDAAGAVATVAEGYLRVTTDVTRDAVLGS